MVFHAKRELTFSATSVDSSSAPRPRFVERKPLRPLGAPVRSLIIPDIIDGVLDGTDASTGFPSGRADARIAQYIAGQLVFVSLIGTSADHVNLERLRDVDEVWMFCFRSPPPGWRLFGRFWARNKFYGLRLYDRHELPSDAAFAVAATETILDYEAMVGTTYLRASSVGEYLTGVWKDVDEPIE